MCYYFFREPDISDGSGELHDKKGLPIYSRDSKLWSTRKCFSALLNSNLDISKVCIIVFFSVDINSAFIVDLNQLGSSKDFFVMIWVFGNGVAVIESGAKQMRKET